MFQQMENKVCARLIGSPLYFSISERAAALCLIGLDTIVHHDQLGPLLCKVIVMHEDGRIREVHFVGTSNRKLLNW